MSPLCKDNSVAETEFQSNSWVAAQQLQEKFALSFNQIELALKPHSAGFTVHDHSTGLPGIISKISKEATIQNALQRLLYRGSLYGGFVNSAVKRGRFQMRSKEIQFASNIEQQQRLKKIRFRARFR